MRTHLIFILTLTIISCKPQNYLTSTPDKIGIYSSFPIIKTSGEFTILNDSVYFYSLGKYEMYVLPIRHLLQVEGNYKETDKTYEYFTYKKGDLYGSYTITLNDSVNKKYLVDSLRKSKGFYGVEMEKLLDSSYFVNETMDKYGILIKKYIYNSSNTENAFDTIYMYFNHKLKNIPFSFSKVLDSTIDSKLFKIRIVNLPQYSKQFSFYMPLREIKMEVVKIAIEKTDSCISYLEKLNKTRFESKSEH